MLSVNRDGTITLHMRDVLYSMGLTDKKDVIDRLACDEEIIEEVTNQILDGVTTEGSCGSWPDDKNAESHTALGKARKRIALCSGQVTKEIIEALQRRVTDEVEENKKLSEQVQQLRSIIERR